MSPPQEAELGDKLAEEIEKEYPVFRADAEATAYLQGLGEELVKVAPPCQQTFRFQLIDSDEVNAFAIPGGYCYVQVGLLRETGNEAELAAVLAHEIGHVTERHGAKAVSRAQFYGLVGALALGDDPKKLAEVAEAIIRSGILLRHSREDELEADAVAVRTLHRAGIEPDGLVRFFEKLRAKEGRRGGLFEYFSTHPLTTMRIEIAKGLIGELGPGAPDRRSDSAAFRAVKKRYPPSSE